MKKLLIEHCHKGHQCSLFYLIILNLIRLGVQITLYRQGFISVAADEFARGIRAAKWAQNPSFNILADVQGTWLPLEKYLNGFALLVWPDAILSPRVTVFIASSLLIVVIYFLANYLFNSRVVGVLSTLLISFQPWYVWLSGTPMLEMYYFVLFFAGLLLLLNWLKEGRRGYWFWAGICFLLATGFHVQSWTLINLVNLITIPFLYKFIRRKEYASGSKLIAYYVLSNSLVIGFGLIEYLYTGELFAFLAKHTSYSRWYYNGYDVSVWEKFLYYPRLLAHNASSAIWIGLIISFVFLVWDKDIRWKTFPFLVALSSLLLNSVMNIVSGPPSAAPNRYSLFHVIVLSLYFGYGIVSLTKLREHFSSKFVIYLSRLAVVFLLVYGIWWGVDRVPHYPQGMSLDSVEVGKTLYGLLDKNPGGYMVELRYWDFLAVDLMSQHYEAIVFDREKNNLNRDTPSIFLQEPVSVCQNLMQSNLQYIVLIDEELKLYAEQLALLSQIQRVGRWTIYKIVPDTDRTDTICG